MRSDTMTNVTGRPVEVDETNRLISSEKVDGTAVYNRNGDRLGTVGGRIVTEVIVTLLDRDPTSVRFADADWKPRRSLLDLLRTGA